MVLDGTKTDHGQLDARLVQTLAHRVQRRLGIQGVEHRLDQQQVDAALDQGPRRLRVARHQGVETDVPEPRVVHVGRERSGSAGRSQRTGDEALPPRARRHLVGHAARQPCRGPVQLGDQRLHVVVRLRDGIRVEGVRGDDIGTRQQILAMNVCDDLWLRQDQEVVVAAQIAAPVSEARTAELRLGQTVPLDHRAHRTVEEDQALWQQLEQLSRARGQRIRSHHDATRTATGADAAGAPCAAWAPCTA